MKELLQQKVQYAIEGVREFYKHPIKYSIEGVKNYWDVGVTAAAAFALTPFGNDLYNNLIPEYSSLDAARKLQVGIFGGTAGLLTGGMIRDYIREGGGFKGLRTVFLSSKEKADSFFRNGYAGLTAFLVGADLGAYDDRLYMEFGMKFVEALSFAGFAIMEHSRLNQDAVSFQNNHKTLEDSL